MSIRRVVICLSLIFVAVILIGIAFRSPLSSQGSSQTPTIIAGRNVNMVSGTTLPGGDPWLQRQNEPSIAVSSRNPLHLLAGCNDYRTVDMPTDIGGLPGKIPGAATGDAWLGVFASYDGGESWTSTLLPGYPQDPNHNNPFQAAGYSAAADPVVRSGPNGIFYYSGIAFNRTSNLGVVFVARFIDNNNKEGGGSIQYIDTKIIAIGSATKFLDKPWTAVDQPRLPVGNITVAGQRIPRHNVYITYSAFTGSGSSMVGDIMFARSTDCGTTWGAPIKLSSGSYAHQGATIAIKPVLGEVLVAFRRFAQPSSRTPDSIFVAQSFTRGLTFASPVKVADIAPFDQPTTEPTQWLPGTGPGPAFRTNSYPTMAMDADGHVYLAWSQRNLGPAGGARIVVSSSYFGSSWSTPQLVSTAAENASFLGHQIMPSFSFVGGKLMLVWYDQRHDVSGQEYGYNNWILDDRPYRHTMDVWAAVAETKTFPTLTWKATQVSRYLYAALKGDDGEIITDANGHPIPFPVQFNCVNYTLFKGGLDPFMGDYIDVAASSTFRLDTWRNWYINATSSDSPVFHIAWTDNRDVRPPLDGDWTAYRPASSTQDSSFITPGRPECQGDGNGPGMRNQNIYTARVTWGIEAGSPMNTKTLNLSGGTARAFVVFVKNNTNVLRHFKLAIAAQPVGGQASFLQFGLLTALNVDIAPYCTVSRPVFISSTDPTAAVTINVDETDASGSVVTGGLKSSILINGDPTNPQVPDTDETHDPEIVNPSSPNIVDWWVNPNIVDPNIVDPNIVDPNIIDPNIVDPNIVDPNIVDPNIVDPNIVDPNIVDPNIVGRPVADTSIVNPMLVNPVLVNPNIIGVNPQDLSITDVEWTVRNKGNTITTYSLKALSKKAPPEGVYVQLLVYRVHYTPAVAGAELSSAHSGLNGCALKQEPHHELVLNLINPNIVDPNIVDPNIVDPNIVGASIENATFSVAPGEEVVVDLRVLNTGLTKTGGAATAMATAAPSEAPPPVAANIKEFIDSLGFAVTSQAVNSADARNGIQIPPAAATTLVIGTASLPDGVVDAPYNATLLAYGGSGSYVWTFESGELPPGLLLSSDGLISGTPTTPGMYNFIVRVDSGDQFDTQRYSIYVYSGNQPGSLTILTNSLPSGMLGYYYGATLEATGGVWPRTWRLASGYLPLGLTLDSGGVISGTIQQEAGQDYPTAYNFSVVVTDKNGVSSASKPLSIYVNLWTKTYIKISGTVYSTGGTPLNGVVMRGLPNTPVSGANGTPGYYEDTVPSLWSGTVIPFKAGETFSPGSRTYTQVASNQDYQDYNFQYFSPMISGSVTFYGAGLAGVVLNGLPGNPSTDLNGSYAVTVTYGWSGTVTPTKDGYTFTPSTQAYTNVVLNQTTNYNAATIIGPANKLAFTQNPGGGVGGVPWTVQPVVEVQDANGNRVTSDSSTVVTLTIKNNPAGGNLSPVTSVTASNGVATFSGLSIDKGGYGYTLEATSTPTLQSATSETFSIEGFSATKNLLANVMKWETATPTFISGVDKVLMAGGLSADASSALSDFSYYDPATNQFEIPGTHSMSQARELHTATSLLDGTILIAGGNPNAQTAELFDPGTGLCTPVADMSYPRAFHRATLLQDGRVLITGTSEFNPATDQPVAEIYDPKTKTFSETSPMAAARFSHTSTLLANGKVLITGGGDCSNDGVPLASAELYDPQTGMFIAIDDMAGPRMNHQATLLDDGRVLITGGDSSTNKTAEIYDPTPSDSHPNGFFEPTEDMLAGHKGHQAALLRDGSVLIMGGDLNSGVSNEIYSPQTSTFRETGPMSSYRVDGAAAVLPDGRVLIAGGYKEEGMSGPADVWNPVSPFPTHVISGTITAGGVGVGGVMLVGLPGHPMTNAGGYYEGLVLTGWTGTVTPTKPGYTFNPPSLTYPSVQGAISGQDYTVSSVPPVPFKLAFVQQPSNTVAGAVMSPAVTVEIQDALGNRVTTATNTVTLLLTNAGTAILSGTNPKAAVGGVATFSDLTVDKAGTGYILRANSGSLKEVDSGAFDVTALVLDHFDITPSVIGTQIINTPFQITITAKDAGGNVVTNYSGTNTLSLNFYPYTDITPTSVTLVDGVWQGNVTVTVAEYGVVISTSGAGKSGQCNAFDVLYPGPYSTISGQVTYNGAPFTTGANVDFSLFDYGSGHGYPIPPSSFNQAIGTYSIPNVRSGTYGIFLKTDSNTPPNYQPDPGDFWGGPTPSQFSVTAPTPVTVNFAVRKLIHLTAPADNNPPGILVPPPYPIYSSPVTFVWDPIAEATTYSVQVYKYKDDTYQYLGIAYSETGIGTTQMTINLPSNAADDHYGFSMFAFNASMAQVGDFYVPLTNPGGGIYGFGTEFSFKVAPTLIASFNYQPASPVVGQAVQFTDTSTGSPTSWQWSFGDGTTSTAQNPAHTFTTAASYTVTLTVTNASGSNNVSQTVAIALPPDLRIWGISPQPGFPKSTDIITFYVEVRNNGAGPAGASTARLVVGSLTYYLPISTLAAGTSQTVTQAVGPLANGMYPVTGTADVNNDVFESNETNNQASFNLGVGPPDLVVESVTYSPANPKSTDPISVYVVIRNQGYQRADLSTMSLYIEGKGTINYGVDYIYVNDTYTVYASVGTLSAGTHAVTATADVNNVVAELDEENNVYTGSITVTAPPLPDLTEGLFKDEPPPQGRLAILSSWLMSKTSGSDWLAHQRRN